MKAALTLFAIGFVLFAASLWPKAPSQTSGVGPRTPVLVELFTSEGCSSCPPADQLLERLESQQPVAGAEMVVLSEHVDYWNYIGWNDPFSSHLYSGRQAAYASRLSANGAYTPQMVVDGVSECVGSSTRAAEKVVEQAAKSPKIAVHVSSVSSDATNIHAQIDTGVLDPSFGAKEVEVFVATALNHAESRVARGENAGRHLAHTAVVRQLTKIGVLPVGQKFAKEITLKLEPGSNPENIRLIAFLQQPHQGRVLGVAIRKLSN